MNQKGIFLTLMVFVVIVSVLVIFQNNQETRATRDESVVSETVLNSVNQTFEQPYFEVVRLQKTGKEQRVQSRGLPFDYNLTENELSIRQSIPLNPQRLQSFYDMVNAYKIFLGEPGITEAGMDVKLELDRSGLADGWQNEFPQIKYVAIPQCVTYIVNEGGSLLPENLDSFAITPGTKNNDDCSADFSATLWTASWADVNAVKVTVETAGDLEPGTTIKCKQDLDVGGNICRNDLFTGKRSNSSYVSVILKSHGASPQVVAQGYVSLGNNGAESDVSLDYILTTDTHLTSVDIRVIRPNALFSVQSKKQGPPAPITATAQIQFRTPILEFFLYGVDLSVQKEGFDIVRYS